MTHHIFKTIGIGVAFSPNLKANIYEASRLAILFQAKLLLIHVGRGSEEKTLKIEENLKPFLDRDLDCEIIFKPGDPVDVILQSIHEKNIDLILLGALQREQFIQFYIGSIARKITRKASCAVLLHINPSIQRIQCEHIIVNGMDTKRAPQTIASAFYFANKLGTERITIVEEIGQDEVAVSVEDHKSLRKATIIRDQLRQRESIRVQKVISQIPENLRKGISVSSQPIFGRRGYSIGHYAELVRADLLVINASRKSGLMDRLFPHDNEYILKELPTDVLILP